MIKLIDSLGSFKKSLVSVIVILVITQCFVTLTFGTDKLAGLLDDPYFSLPLNFQNTLYVGGSGPGNYSNIQDEIQCQKRRTRVGKKDSGIGK